MCTLHVHKVMQTSLKIGLALGLLLLPLAAFALPARADDQDVLDTAQGEVEVLRQVRVGDQLQTTISIAASKATFIAYGLPNNNFGGYEQLGLGYNSPTYLAMRILIKFNLSAIPANATINSASFQIYQFDSIPDNDSPMGIQVQYASRSWDEASATWNNAKDIGENPPLGVGYFDNTADWKYGTATNVVRNWYSGAKTNNGVLLIADESPGPNRSRWFYSNNQASLYPRLTVDYTVQCDTTPPTAYITSISPQTWVNGNPYSPGAFNVTWTGFDSAPASCAASGVNSYKISYSTDNVNWTPWLSWGGATSGTFNLGLSSGTRVYFYAQAQDKAGNKQATPAAGSGQMNTIVDTSGPIASVDPLQPYTTSTAFVVSWDASDDASGAATYNLQQSLNGGTWQTPLSNTPQTSYQVTGATTGQKYAFRVQAIDRVGNVGPWSASVSTTIFAQPFAVLRPIDPQIIKPTSPVTSTIYLTWTGYTPGGTTITQYVVWFNYDSLGWTAVVPSLPGGNTGTYAFNWVQRGFGDGLFLFKITATNNLGLQTPADFPYGQASAIVDMADRFQVRAYLPVVCNNAP